jgi:hypothetical protein
MSQRWWVAKEKSGDRGMARASLLDRSHLDLHSLVVQSLVVGSSWGRAMDGGLGGGGLGGFVGLGGDGVCGVGGFDVSLDVVVDALHAFFESAQTFTETLAELRQLLAAEEKDSEARQDDKVPRLK